MCRSRRTAKPSLLRSSASCTRSTPPPPSGTLGRNVPLAGAAATASEPIDSRPAGARREPLHPIRMQQVRHAAHAEPTPLETGEDAPAGDLLYFRAHALQVVLAHRLGDVLERGAERLLPGKGIALSLGQERDLVA